MTPFLAGALLVLAVLVSVAVAMRVGFEIGFDLGYDRGLRAGKATGRLSLLDEQRAQFEKSNPNQQEDT